MADEVPNRYRVRGKDGRPTDEPRKDAPAGVLERAKASSRTQPVAVAPRGATRPAAPPKAGAAEPDDD